MTNTNRKSRRIGRRMSQLAAYVERHPGCSMLSAAKHVGPHGSLNYGYQTAHRAVRAGIVWAIKGNGRYRLYPVAVAS